MDGQFLVRYDASPTPAAFEIPQAIVEDMDILPFFRSAVPLKILPFGPNSLPVLAG